MAGDGAFRCSLPERAYDDDVGQKDQMGAVRRARRSHLTGACDSRQVLQCLAATASGKPARRRPGFTRDPVSPMCEEGTTGVQVTRRKGSPGRHA